MFFSQYFSTYYTKFMPIFMISVHTYKNGRFWVLNSVTVIWQSCAARLSRGLSQNGFDSSVVTWYTPRKTCFYYRLRDIYFLVHFYLLSRTGPQGEQQSITFSIILRLTGKTSYDIFLLWRQKSQYSLYFQRSGTCLILTGYWIETSREWVNCDQISEKTTSADMVFSGLALFSRSQSYLSGRCLVLGPSS